MKKEINLSFYRTPGFYLAILSVILAYVANFVYLGISDTLLEYREAVATIPAFIGLAIFAIALIFRRSAKFSGLLLWASIFISLLLYINYVYMYFSGVFYNGVTAEAFKLIDSKVLLSMIFYILAAIFSNVAIFLPMQAKEKAEAK